VIDFASKQPGAPPFRVLAKHTRLAPVSGPKAVNFETDLRLPMPPGDVHSEGRLGPWNQRDPFATRVSASYTLHHGDLSFAGGIAGMLESQGMFRGPLRQLDVVGSAAVPDFRVVSANHPAGLTARFHATANGETGETVLHAVALRFGHTEVSGAGTVSGQSPDNEKLTTLTLAVPHGRIEDLLYLLTQAPPRMKGDLTVQTRVAMPDNSEPFLKKLQMQGDFQITNALFTELSTEHALDRIRDRSRHEQTDYAKAALGKIEGRGVVSGGVARLSHIEFQDPGASAQVAGTFNLLSERVDLRGTAHLDTGLSSAARGLKAFFLKVLSPFFKSRRRKGSTVPIKITGSYGHTSVGIDPSAAH
jgi:AsmA-like protein